MRIAFLFLFALCLSHSVFASTVAICDDINEWPPYAYYDRSEESEDKKKITGALIELLDRISELSHYEFTFQFLPWKRCTEEVHSYGNGGKFEALVNGTYNQERAERYYLIELPHKVENTIFYSSKAFPKGLPNLKTYQDLANYKICGMHGYNYDFMYKGGLPENIKIDTGAKGIGTALKRVSLGFCDVIQSEYAYVQSRALFKEFVMPSDIRHQNLSDVPPLHFYMMVAKKSPRAEALVTNISQALITLKENGELNRIYGHYLPSWKSYSK